MRVPQQDIDKDKGRRPASGSGYLAAEDRVARSTEDRRLLERYHRDGDPAAREALVERFLPLARQLARRYQHGSEQLDDLVQVASLGLLKAIDRFDPARETAFSSFAVPTILGELKRHFRDKGWAVRVPRDLQELAVRVDRVTDELARELGRAPAPPPSCPATRGAPRPPPRSPSAPASASSRCSRRARPAPPTGRSPSTARVTRRTRRARAWRPRSGSRTPASTSPRTRPPSSA